MSTTIGALLWTVRLVTALLWRYGLITPRAKAIRSRFLRRLEWRTKRLRLRVQCLRREIAAAVVVNRDLRRRGHLIRAEVEVLKKRRIYREACRR